MRKLKLGSFKMKRASGESYIFKKYIINKLGLGHLHCNNTHLFMFRSDHSRTGWVTNMLSSEQLKPYGKKRR